MLKKLITLFKLGRKIAQSDILNITSKFQEPPLIVKLLFKILSFSFSPKNLNNINKDYLYLIGLKKPKFKDIRKFIYKS